MRAPAIQQGKKQALRLSVPVPPTTNHLYATVNNRRVKTREAREYAELVRDRVWLWKQLHGDPPLPPYRLTIEVHAATNRRTDISNSIKCLEDGLFLGLQSNDKTVLEVIARVGEKDPLNPRAEITLEHVEV